MKKAWSPCSLFVIINYMLIFIAAEIGAGGSLEYEEFSDDNDLDRFNLLSSNQRYNYNKIFFIETNKQINWMLIYSQPQQRRAAV